jgi:SAM-dependent methyltransferase
VSGFSSDWLALREGADTASRDVHLTERLAGALSRRAPLRVLDLGAGTGSNLRFLAPRLGGPQRWQLIDKDPALLEQLQQALGAWADREGHRAIAAGEGLLLQGPGFDARVDWASHDLAADPETWFTPDTDLVTASALLDLVSRDWIDALASTCLHRGCAALFTLSYDGRILWDPVLHEDATVRDALNRHQRRHKGLGPALGPEAAAYAAERFTALGYAVHQGRSDWCLAPAQAALQEALARGWAEAATALDGTAREDIEDWLAARIQHIRRDGSRLRVGHRDMLALMPAAGSEHA